MGIVEFIDADSVADAPDNTVSVTFRRQVGGSSGTVKKRARPARFVLVEAVPIGSEVMGKRAHEVAPSGSALVCVRPHTVHARCPVSENVSIAHCAVTAVSPLMAQYEPAVQASQTVLPVVAAKVPAAHSVDARRPLILQKLPAGHTV
jgi:hypothetical protein